MRKKYKKYYVAYYTEHGYCNNYIATVHNLNTRKGLIALTQDIKEQYSYTTVVILNIIPLKG